MSLTLSSDPATQQYTIADSEISQPVSHLYIVITHCIFTIPTFLTVVLFLLLLHCYTVLLIYAHKTNQCHNASAWKNGFSMRKNCMMRNL